MVARRLEVIIPARLWEKLEELEQKTGVRKEDIFMRAVVMIVEGVRCPSCGKVVYQFEEVH